MPASPLPEDPYEVLGVAKDADTAAIRAAHRKKVLTSHPDKFTDEAVKADKVKEFHSVQQAYELLSDEARRRRYDAQVRLAKLRAEDFINTVRESATARRQEPTFSPRPAAERSWTSPQPMYEEIRPKTARYEYDSRPDPPRPSPRYTDEPPRSARRERDYDAYDAYDDYSPAHGISKKGASSTTARSTEPRAEDSTRVRNKWKAATTKLKEKEMKENEDRRKSRDKGRRDDGQSKKYHAHADSASDLGSDVESFMGGHTYSPRTERPRSYEEDKQRSRRKGEQSRTSSPDGGKARHNISTATEYILKSMGKNIDRDIRGDRPALHREKSSSRGNQVPPPPPPPPPVPIVDDAIRSSARRGAVSSSKSTKSSKRDLPEIVEPRSKRDYDTESRRPDLKSSVTSPTTIKPLRSSTLDIRGSDRIRGAVRRSATSPLAPLSASSRSHKSKLGETHDSGYSSPGTPEIQPQKKKTYHVVVESESESDSDRAGPRYVVIDPDRRTREPSPRTSSYRSERSERSGGSSRHLPHRSQTVDEPSTHSRRPAPLSRAATERSDMLFGEVRGSPESRDRAKYHTVRESPRYGPSDVSYGSVRRTSPTERGSLRADLRGDDYDYPPRRGSVPIRPSRAAVA